LQSWLQSANAKNAVCWLSAQLAALELSVNEGYVKMADVIYAGSLLQYQAAGIQVTGLTSTGFMTVASLIKTANDALGLYASALGGDPARQFLLTLAQVVQATTDNSNFVNLSSGVGAELKLPLEKASREGEKEAPGEPFRRRQAGSSDPNQDGAGRELLFARCQPS